MCGSRYDGNAGYYRCHDRCGNPSIKKAAVEESILNLIVQEVLSEDSLRSLMDEVKKIASKTKDQPQDVSAQLEPRLAGIDKKVREIVKLITEVKHPRPLIDELDKLEEERQQLLDRQTEITGAESQPLIQVGDDRSVRLFLQTYRKNLEADDAETRKAVIRSLIDHAILNGNDLEVFPSYEKITGFKMASPRGFEPLLPP